MDHACHVHQGKRAPSSHVITSCSHSLQLASDRGMVVVNESYVLPVLARLRGEPVVSDWGGGTEGSMWLDASRCARREM